jgi:predicted nucleic acid-binding protein
MIEARQPGYVVDASVGLKWLLKLDDEPHHQIADQILLDYTAGAVWLNTVLHTPWEVGNALTSAIRRERLTHDQAVAAMQMFEFWNIPPVGDFPDYRLRSIDLALEYGCSFYDASYLAAAELVGNPLVHADERLRRQLNGRFALELWIQDYVPVRP